MMLKNYLYICLWIASAPAFAAMMPGLQDDPGTKRFEAADCQLAVSVKNLPAYPNSFNRLARQGWTCHIHGFHDQAERYLKEALGRAQRHTHRALALSYLSDVYRAAGKEKETKQNIRKAVELVRKQHHRIDPLAFAAILDQQGNVLRLDEDYSKAKAAYGEALQKLAAAAQDDNARILRAKILVSRVQLLIEVKRSCYDNTDIKNSFFQNNDEFKRKFIRNFSAALSAINVLSNKYEKIQKQLHLASLALRFLEEEKKTVRLRKDTLIPACFLDSRVRGNDGTEMSRLKRKAEEKAGRLLNSALIRKTHRILLDIQQQKLVGSSLRFASYANAYMGRLYRHTGRYEDAMSLIGKAVFQAQEAGAQELEYRWERLRGRLWLNMNDENKAIGAYRRALALLHDIRFALRNSTPFQETALFRKTEEGRTYFDLIELLLKKAGKTQNPQNKKDYLYEAKAVLERLKTAELEDYFKDDCVETAKKKAQNKSDCGQGAVVLRRR